MATQISMTFLEDMNFNATVVVSSSFFRFRAPIFLLIIDTEHGVAPSVAGHANYIVI